jgi:hypothetical protein
MRQSMISIKPIEAAGSGANIAVFAGPILKFAAKKCSKKNALKTRNRFCLNWDFFWAENGVLKEFGTQETGRCEER